MEFTQAPPGAQAFQPGAKANLVSRPRTVQPDKGGIVVRVAGVADGIQGLHIGKRNAQTQERNPGMEHIHIRIQQIKGIVHALIGDPAPGKGRIPAQLFQQPLPGQPVGLSHRLFPLASEHVLHIFA